MNLLPALATLALVTTPIAASADTANAFCRLSFHDHTVVPRSGPCNIGQLQGDIYVYMHTGDEFLFRTRDRGHTYTLNNTEKGVIFRVPEAFSLQVLQEEPREQLYTL